MVPQLSSVEKQRHEFAQTLVGSLVPAKGKCFRRTIDWSRTFSLLPTPGPHPVTAPERRSPTRPGVKCARAGRGGDRRSTRDTGAVFRMRPAFPGIPGLFLKNSGVKLVHR